MERALAPVQDDWPRLEPLDRDECLRLLRPGGVGRVAIVDGRSAVVFPVNFAVDGESIVFCSATGTKLASAAHHDEVAFEADHADAQTHSGWSVVVRGPASVIRDPDELVAVHRLPLRPWVPSARAHWIRIEAEELTGRRLVSPAGA